MIVPFDGGHDTSRGWVVLGEAFCFRRVVDVLGGGEAREMFMRTPSLRLHFARLRRMTYV